MTPACPRCRRPGSPDRGVGVQQRVQAVAGDPAQDVRVAAADLVAVAVGELQARRAAARPGGRRPAPCGSPRRAASGQVDRRAAASTQRRPTPGRRRAVDDRAHPGRVVADHPAERRDGRRRGVGAEDEPVGRGVGVEVGLDRAGLHAGARGSGVELEHRSIALVSSTRPGEVASPARLVPVPRGGDRHAGRTRGADRAAHVGLRAGEHDADRVAAVDRRIRGPERARHRVGAQLAVQPPVERRVQPLRDHDRRSTSIFVGWRRMNAPSAGVASRPNRARSSCSTSG